MQSPSFRSRGPLPSSTNLARPAHLEPQRWLHQLTSSLHRLLTADDSMRVTRQIWGGRTYWVAYDPTTSKQYLFESEDEGYAWLEAHTPQG